VQSLLQEAGLAKWLSPKMRGAAGSIYSRAAENKALWWGVGLGITATFVTCFVCCCCRRYKKKMIKKPARAYMAYGETDMPADACDGATEMTAEGNEAGKP